MEIVKSIIERYEAGESKSSIARNLHVDRKTVTKYMSQRSCSLETVEEKIKKERGSKLDPYKEEIDELLDEEERSGVFWKQRFTAARMHSYLVNELGHKDLENSYLLVQRYMRKRKTEIKRTYDDPGTMSLIWHPAEAQADFGEADFYEGGELVRYKYFALTFPYSNRKIALVMPGENCECVCTALQLIFKFIGGVPVRIVFDNATGIGKRYEKILRENIGFTKFRVNYRFKATFANPYSGHEKGSVENAVGTIRRNTFVPPMSITTDLMRFNTSLMTKIFNSNAEESHYKKGAKVRDLYEEDAEALLSLPANDFTVNRINKVKSNKRGEVILDGKYTYCLGPIYTSMNLLCERRAFAILFYTAAGKHIKTFDRLYGKEPQQEYDIDSLVLGLQNKPRAWQNSVVREQMQDGLLKAWLDAQSDSSLLRRTFYTLGNACMEYGSGDVFYAAELLLKKNNNKFPGKSDLTLMCARMRECGLETFNPTGVNLGQFDFLLTTEEANREQN